MVHRALLLLVFVAGCSAEAGELRTDLRDHHDQPLAPTFDLLDRAGAHRRLNEFQGKVVLVNFWATWCGPCRQELSALQIVWDTLPRDSFEIVAINVGEDASVIGEFLRQTRPAISFEVLLDDNMIVSRHWGVRVLPTTFVLDGLSHIRYSAEGGRDLGNLKILDRIRVLTAELGTYQGG